MQHTNRYIIVAATICAILLSCCKSGSKLPDTHTNTQPVQPNKEVIADVNRYLSEKDKAVIEGYARRNKLNLTASESGFYYTIFNEGKGKPITENSIVAITGTLSLIDGTLCYTYDANKPKTIAIAKSPEIAGLHLALPMLKQDGSALFIFPPNLAFGLLGDDDRVPPRTTIVMNIKVLKVED